MEELGLPDLTTEQIVTLCSTVEHTARKYILSQVPLKLVEELNVSVEVEGAKPVNVTVEVELLLSPKINDVNAETLADEAVKAGLEASEIYLRKQK